MKRMGRGLCTKPCSGRPSRPITVSAEQLWGQAHSDVIKNGMTPAAAVDRALRRAEAIFANFTFG
jgi:hypothetical protein